jgi:hypothetical protein
MTAGGPLLLPLKTSTKLASDKEVKEEKKKKKKKKEEETEKKSEEEEEEEVACMTKKLKLICINMEPYIENHVRKNYFKLYELMPFQMKGITFCFSPPLSSSLYIYI